jgi:cell wall-associated NlpC family hydrolase
MRQAAPEFDDLLGIPFVDGGRNPETGLDCWGLFMLVMERFDIQVPDYKLSCFASQDIHYAAQDALMDQWEKIDGPGPGIGVVLEINPRMPGIIQHFGVCINKYKFIHTLKKTNSIMSDIYNGMWSNKIKGFYRWQDQ